MKRRSNILGLLFLFTAEQAVAQTKSYIDSQYELFWNSERPKRGVSLSTESSSLRFYQASLSEFLGSECDWMPTDSGYAQTSIRSCGAVKGIFKSSSRFMLEYDAANLGYPVVSSTLKNYFWDSPYDCSWF